MDTSQVIIAVAQIALFVFAVAGAVELHRYCTNKYSYPIFSKRTNKILMLSVMLLGGGWLWRTRIADPEAYFGVWAVAMLIGGGIFLHVVYQNCKHTNKVIGMAAAAVQVPLAILVIYLMTIYWIFFILFIAMLVALLSLGNRGVES